MDVYAVGIEIKSDGVTATSQRLREAQRELGRTETATERMERSARNSATSLRQMGSAISALHGPLGGVASRFRSLGTLIGQTGFILGAFTIALGAIALTARKVFREYISETIDAEMSTLRLEQALRSTAATSGHSLASVQLLTQQFRELTTFSTNSIEAVQSTLLSFRNVVGDVLPRATQATLDLAQALGRDAASAAQLVGRAMNDPIGALQSLQGVGVRFTQSQTAMIRNLVISGQGFKAQSVILQALEKQYGGAAEAAKNTLGGAMSILSNRWNDLFKLGSTASEGLRSAILKLAEAISSPAFVNFAQTMGSLLFRAITAATNAMTAFVGIMPEAVRLLTVFGATWAMYMAPRIIMGSAAAIATWAVGSTVAVTSLTGAFTIFAATLKGVVVAAAQAVYLAFRSLTAAMMANPFGFVAVVITGTITALWQYRDETVRLRNTTLSVGNALTAVWTTVSEAVNMAMRSVTWLAEVTGKFIALDWSGAMEANARASNDFAASLERIASAWREVDVTRFSFAANMPDGVKIPQNGAGKGASFEIFNEGRQRRQRSEYESAIEQMREQSQQLSAEAQVVGLSTYAKEKYLATQTLINAALKDGLEITPNLEEEIRREAHAIAYRTSVTEQAIEAQRRLDDLRGTFQSSMSSFAQDIARGSSALDSLASALQRVADKLIDMAVNDLFENAFGKAGTVNSFFGSLANGGGLGGLFAALPGFANGGSFQVGGAGGIDSQLVAFRATPGERVTVSKKGEEDGGLAILQPRVVVNNYADASVDSRTREDGTLELTVRAIVRDEFGSERMNPIMRNKHGIAPRLRAR